MAALDAAWVAAMTVPAAAFWECYPASHHSHTALCHEPPCPADARGNLVLVLLHRLLHVLRQVDMWSAGVVLFILLGGYPPFWSDSEPALFEQIRRCKYSFDDPVWDVVSDA